MLQFHATFFLLAFKAGVLLGAPEVQLPNGLIRGYEDETFKETPYFAFEKIPYASPPVGKLRFKAPVPPENWEEPLDTAHLDVTCYQERANTDQESEDCLYLNVFTPQLPSEENNVSLPVMLFIHGGGFVGGSGRSTFADKIIDENIVFVVINYRLGPFGFLSTEDEIIPGNNGLKDQQLALTWTHDNIHLFGGDASKVTIFGQSAGSASCSYQLLNLNSQGLFQGAILESGSFLSPWAFQRRAREIAFTAASALNETFKTNQNSQDLLEYLQSVRAKSIDRMAEDYFYLSDSPQNREILQGFDWAPVVEVENPDAFITEKMYGQLESGKVVPVPVLIGMNSEEYIFYGDRDPDLFEMDMADYDENLSWLVPNDMKLTDETEKNEMGAKIREIYTGGESFTDHLGDGIRYGSDTAFTRSIIKQAELYSQFADTYFYQFSYDGTIGHINTQYEGAEHVGHGQETKYIFCHKTSCDMSDYPEMDQVTADRLIKIWTDFAKYQNPTPEPSQLLQNITWPLVSTKDGDFLYVDIDENLEIRNHPKEATYGKWNELYNSLDFNNFDTY